MMLRTTNVDGLLCFCLQCNSRAAENIQSRAMIGPSFHFFYVLYLTYLGYLIYLLDIVQQLFLDYFSLETRYPIHHE